jgi:hypothetical protein
MVKQYHYRSRKAPRVQGVSGSQISHQSVHDGGKVVSSMHQPPLPPRNILSTHLFREVTGSIPAVVSGFFIYIKSFRSHYDAAVDSASNRNNYREYFVGVKAADAQG